MRRRDTAHLILVVAAAGLAAAVWACTSGPLSAQAPCSGDMPGLLAESRGGRIMLGASPVRVALRNCRRGALDAQVRAMAPGARVILLVEDLRAENAPGVVYQLELAHAGADDGASLGSLNFFAARAPGAGGRNHAVSYDVTAAVRGLAARGRLGSAPSVTLAPTDAPAPGARASVARVRLAMQ